MSWELWGAGVLATAGWLWWDGLQKREIAVRAARLACEKAGVQFLDDSVAQTRLRLAKDENLRTRFAREFAFEFSSTGDNRLAGRVHMLGARVLDVNLILPPEPAEASELPIIQPTAQVIQFHPRRD